MPATRSGDMEKKVYKRKAGEFEIRILPDGRVVMLAPDEALMDVARAVEGQDSEVETTEKGKDGRARDANGTGGGEETERA